MLIKNSIAVVIQQYNNRAIRNARFFYSANKISRRGSATSPFFPPYNNISICSKFSKETALQRRSSLGVENFPISNFLLLIALNKENYRTSKNRLASMCRSREEEVLEGKGRETLFRNRLSRTKGMTPALCFECAPRTSVATLPRFIGFQWASLVASIEGCTFDAAFPRTEEETGCDKMENSNSIVAQTCKIIRHSLSRSRGSIRVANYTVLSRDIGDIKTQKKREREREARTRSSRIPRRCIDFHGRRLMMAGACTG